MAPVTWNRGPWATRSMPYQSLQAPASASAPIGAPAGAPAGAVASAPTGSPYGSLIGSGPGDMGGNPGRGPQGRGEAIAEAVRNMLSPEDRLGFDVSHTFNAMRSATGLLGPQAAPVSIGLSALGLARGGWGAHGINVGAVAKAFGLPEDTVQAFFDMQPDLGAAVGVPDIEGELGGYVGATGNMEGSIAGSGQGGFGSGEPGSTEGTAGADKGGMGSGIGESQMGGSDAGAFARRGGDFRFRRPTRLNVAEPGTGGERVLAIPRTMERPGIQGRERQVRRGLQGAYASLTGGRR